MNGLDIFLVLVLGYTLLRGIFRGLIREIASICGLVFGFWTAHNNYQWLSELLQQIIPEPEYADIVSYALLFLVVLLAIILLGTGLHRALQTFMLAWPNRILGGLLGLGKGLVLGCLVFLGLSFFLPEDSELLTESKLAPYLRLTLQKGQKLVPEDLHELLLDQKDKYQSLHQDAVPTMKS